MSSRLTLAASQRRHPANAEPVGAPDPGKIIQITLWLRQRQAATQSAKPCLSRNEFGDQFGADPQDIDKILAFAAAHLLRVVRVDQPARTVAVAGRIEHLAKLFDAELRLSTIDNHVYRTREGTLSVPPELAGCVIGVFGFDNRPAASTYRRRPNAKHPVESVSYTPIEIAALYGFPKGAGSGQTIALIELGGGFREVDLKQYWHSLGLGNVAVTAVAVDGTGNTPSGDPDSADGEVVLDIDIAGAVAPDAHIAVYFAPNTDQGFLNAVHAAIHDSARKPSVVSISWGSAESEWTAQAKDAFNAAFADAAKLGVTVCVASGDNGSSDGEEDGGNHVDFPASSPWVLACGGTHLVAKNGVIESEIVWNDGSRGGATGGGVSDYFPLPDYQAQANVPKLGGDGDKAGRGVPDVCGAADPETGYRVLVDGSQDVVGGTSAVAPLWAALIARCNEQLGRNAGFINPVLYSTAARHDPLRDIVSGTNGAFRSLQGWDCCTGLGSPNGAALLELLKNAGS